MQPLQHLGHIAAPSTPPASGTTHPVSPLGPSCPSCRQVYPFSSERKAMSVVVATGAPLPPGGAGSGAVPGRAYVKGAAELLLDRCKLQVGGVGGV